MSGNRVTSVAGLFRGLSHLSMLKLEDLDLHDIHTKNFHILPGLKFVYFDTFRYCRYVPTVAVCLPNFDGVTSTEDLLGWRTLRVAVWVMALVTLFANVVVIFCRAISRKDNKILKLFVKNLAAADLLMGVYLVVIGVQDAMTRGSFNSHALQWADSYTCILAGVLAMVSSETSVFILSFMSLERYLYISEALDGRTLSLRGARLCLAIIWLTSISLAFFPILWIRSFYGNNSVCFPLYINEPYLAGWQYSAFIFLGLNFVSMVVIFGSYVGLFVNIRWTRLSTSRSSDEMNFAFRFFFIVVTNCLCWLPIMCLKVAALAHVEVHQGFYAWLVILVLPINSAVNPALYTFSTSQFQQQMTSAVTTFRRLRYRHNSDTEALRHSSTRAAGSHLQHHHAHPPAPLLASASPPVVEVRGIHLKNLPTPRPLARLSPRDLKNGLLLAEAPTVPEEPLPPNDEGGDDASDNSGSIVG
uniref:G-protein coupled receptors family 1 profile domain-containing protein n=1 Tax=Scylla olivacea TaxID=85551 RepID=A0A0P4W6Y3_SCYOL